MANKAAGTIVGMLLVHKLASPYLSLGFFALMAASAFAIANGTIEATVAAVVPMGLLGINLLASLFTHPRFRADLPLLTFHLALLALLTLFLLARLTYFDGHVNLTRHVAFDGHLDKNERGPWHGTAIDHIRFANEGFTDHYPTYGQYRSTTNIVRWQGENGLWLSAEIGDDHPLIIHGYRIYTTRHRGFALVFEWVPHSGKREFGVVQLDDINTNPEMPDNYWQLTEGSRIWAMLEATPPAPAPGSRLTNLGADTLEHRVVLRTDEKRFLLQPGESIELPTGKLTYVRLDAWMGYLITKDWTHPWLIATVALAIASLVWFYAVRLCQRLPGDDPA